MLRGRPGAICEPLRTLFTAGTTAGLTDTQLLERFTRRRDDDAEAAFAALVARHGPMVHRVCRLLVADRHDAEDVFQATFLVLARKAATIRRPELLGNWLYGTAHRTAQKLRVRSARRLKHEAREAAMAGAQVSTDADALERQAVHREEAQIEYEEIARLPDAYRVAVVLRDLEGQSHEEAARRLRCSDRTLRRRLARARDLLRTRLTRRGLAPTATASQLSAALRPEPASAAIPQITVDAVARAATRFAAGRAADSIVSTLAEGVITAMFWTKLKAIALASVMILTIGIGAGMGVGLGFAAQDVPKRGAPKPGASDALTPRLPSPAEQYRALVKGYDDATAALSKLVETAKTEAERNKLYMDHGLAEKDFNPRFLALAERYPNDPAAIDALVWITEKTMGYWDGYDDALADATGRTMKILSRDHLGDARFGPLCLKLVLYPSPRRDVFLRAVAERSPDRVVRGHASLALAQYLKMKGEFAESLKKPAGEKEEKSLLGLYGPDYLGQLRAADSRPMLSEADQLYARVLNDYGEIAFTPPSGQPTRETLADVAHRERRPGPVVNPREQFRTLDDAFRVAVKAADRAADDEQRKTGKAEPGAERVQPYIAAYPKWGDYGPKMWRLAQDSPRYQAAFDALIWLVEHGPHFFDAKAERDAVMSQVVDTLIRDHLGTTAEHLTDRNVVMALDMGDRLPTPYRERLLRALFERGRDRLTRGRLGLLLGRYLKSEADCITRLTRPEADSRRPWDLYFLEPAFVEQLRKADRSAIEHEAEAVLERVVADYGDVVYVNGAGTTKETLALAAEHELTEIRSLSVGKQALEISGDDVDGKSMKLSEFRGKVVLLDFGSHEHCGGCAAVYPRLMAVTTSEFRPCGPQGDSADGNRPEAEWL
jgi:RNA polymerase sigma factor (sigma-70 family)